MVKKLSRNLSTLNQGKLRPQPIDRHDDLPRQFRPDSLETTDEWERRSWPPTTWAAIERTAEEILDSGMPLREMLRQKTEIERKTLLGDYTSVESLLAGFELRFGSSYFLYQFRFLAAELRGGLAANRAQFVKARQRFQRPLTQYILSMLSQRAEKSLSAASFSESFNSILKGREATENSLASYLQFTFGIAPALTGISASYVLAFDSTRPAIDRYITLLRILSSLTATHFSDPSLANLTRRLSIESGDPRLAVICRHLQAPQPIAVDAALNSFMEAADEYTRGAYQKSAEAARRAIRKHPDLFEFYQLSVLSIIHGQLPNHNPFEPHSLASDLHGCMYDVYQKNGNTSRSIETLKKLSMQLVSLPLGDQIDAFTRLHSRPLGTTTDKEKHLLINGSITTPLISLYISDAALKDNYIDILEAHFPGSPTIALFKGSAGPEIPASRRLKYAAEDARRNGRWREAVRLYRDLFAVSDGNLPIRDAAVAGLFESLTTAQMFDHAVQLVASIRTENENLVQPLDCELLVQSYPARTITRDPSWAIVGWISFVERSKAPDYMAIYNLYDDFLSEFNTDRPSALGDDVIAGMDHSKIVFFLANICIQEVMHNSTSFESTDELESERIAVCQRLVSLDSKNSEHYIGEIARLTQGIMVRRALRQVDSSRIHIDTKGITASLERTFQERFSRFREYSELTGPLRESLNIGALSPDQEAMVISDASIEQFNELFLDLRNRYISSNEFGLDSYLSVRIRHGTLSGQLRSSLEREHLITRRNEKSGSYDSNPYWVKYFSNLTEEGSVQNGEQLLRDFSSSIDSAIERVKQEWIQIKSPSKPTGLFDYHFTSNELLATQIVDIPHAKDFDSFLNAVFAKLWARTERNLRTVISHIEGPLMTSLTSALDELERGVNAIHPSLAYSSLVAAIVKARTNVRNEVETVAGWFRPAAARDGPDFDFAVAVETAIAMTKNCYPNSGFSCTLSDTLSTPFKGKFLTEFVHVMFILTDNIAKHSGLDSPIANISLRGTPAGLEITAENKVSENVATSSASRLPELKEISARKVLPEVRSEGGSGYHKLHKLLRYELELGDNYRVSVGLSDSIFRVSILITADNFTSENTNH